MSGRAEARQVLVMESSAVVAVLLIVLVAAVVAVMVGSYVLYRRDRARRD